MDMKVNTIESILSRLIEREPTVLATGCREWPGRRCSGHYGQCSIAGKLVMIHRAVWEHLRGPIPEGFEIDHLCRNRICANIEHLRCCPRLQNRGVYLPYAPPPRLGPPELRTCMHGQGKVTTCPECYRAYRAIVNAKDRQKSARRTHCQAGHLLKDGGLRKDGRKLRYCSICLNTSGGKRARQCDTASDFSLF